MTWLSWLNKEAGYWASLLLIIWGIPFTVLWLHSQQRNSSGAYRPSCEVNLRHISQALYLYHQQHGRLPFGNGTGRDPPMSWRVEILPYLNLENLYRRYNTSEPWDSPANIQLVDKLPDVFACPNQWTTQGHTAYRAVSGSSQADVKDYFIVESVEAVPWTKPDVLSVSDFIRQVTERDVNVPPSFGHQQREWIWECGHQFHAVMNTGELVSSGKKLDARLVSALERLEGRRYDEPLETFRGAPPCHLCYQRLGALLLASVAITALAMRRYVPRRAVVRNEEAGAVNR